MFPLKIAYCIIGSLLWDRGDSNKRQIWRDGNLQIENKIYVKVPIRYGRLSSNGHYTMVLSRNSYEKGELGCAYVVPHINHINSEINLKKAIADFSKAEGESSRLKSDQNGSIVKGIRNNWGFISYISNPKISDKKLNLVKKIYKDQFEKFGSNVDFDKYSVDGEGSLLNQDGSSKIDWLNAVLNEDDEVLSGFDLIFITYTKQNVKSYPNADELVKCLNSDDRKYIYNNLRNGIITHYDSDVIK